MPRGTERFPKACRLRNRREFLRVQNGGAKVSADRLLALALETGGPTTRVGFTVSSKVGNAVVRNRVRRRLRELYRKRRDALPRGLDLVIIAKSSAAEADFAELGRDFDELSRKLARRFR